MRAYELLETDHISQGIYDPAQDVLGQRRLSDRRKPKITLRDLHRLNKIRKTRQKEYEKKMALVTVMYGDGNHSNDLELERARFEHEQEMAKLELEKQHIAIQREIEEAKLDQKQRAEISQMAKRAIAHKSR